MTAETRETPEPPAGIVREEPCACGGTAWQLAHQDVRAVVELHQATALHRAWRQVIR